MHCFLVCLITFLLLFRDWRHGRMDPMCPFFAFYSLTDVTEVLMPNSLLDVHIDGEQMSRFSQQGCGQPKEQYFYPSSSAFTAVCVSDGGAIHSHMLGVQRQVSKGMCLYPPLIGQWGSNKGKIRGMSYKLKHRRFSSLASHTKDHKGNYSND